MTDMWHNITFKVSMNEEMVEDASRGEIDDIVEEIFDGVDTEWEGLYNPMYKKFKGIAMSCKPSPVTYTIAGNRVKASRTYDVKYSHKDEEKVQAYMMRDIKDNLERNIEFNTYDLFGGSIYFEVKARIHMAEPRRSSSRRSSSSKRSTRKLEHIFSPRPSSSSRRSSSSKSKRSTHRRQG